MSHDGSTLAYTTWRQRAVSRLDYRRVLRHRLMLLSRAFAAVVPQAASVPGDRRGTSHAGGSSRRAALGLAITGTGDHGGARTSRGSPPRMRLERPTSSSGSTSENPSARTGSEGQGRCVRAHEGTDSRRFGDHPNPPASNDLEGVWSSRFPRNGTAASTSSYGSSGSFASRCCPSSSVSPR